MQFDFGHTAKAYLGGAEALFNIRGFIRDDGLVHPLDTDSKVLATLFEVVVKAKLQQLADDHGFVLECPSEQNYYPDFTLSRTRADGSIERLAVDVKTTYMNSSRDAVKFTLGSYTGCIHPDRETKNILYPYSTYAEHWVVGFVYQRAQSARNALYSAAELDQVPLPFSSVNLFIQEKWRIAGDKPGSGNTNNIGSLEGPLHLFESGRALFSSDAEFLAYWRNFNPSGAQRTYSNLAEFQAWCRNSPNPPVPLEVVAAAKQAPMQMGLFGPA